MAAWMVDAVKQAVGEIVDNGVPDIALSRSIDSGTGPLSGVTVASSVV